jgi:integrase
MLTDAKVRALKPIEKPMKVSDGGGLYMMTQPSGSKLWRMAYRFAGKQKTLAFGIYPEVSLADARVRRDEAKRQLRAGEDPGAVVKAERLAIVATTNTFRAVAADWLQRKMVAEKKAKRTIERARWLLDMLNDGVGDRPINEIEAPELLVVLRKIEAQGLHEAVKRLRSTASSVFRFGIATGACKRDPAADLRGALTSAASTPHAAITEPAGVGKLMRDVDGYDKPLRMALQLLALTFVRPGNICNAEWSEVDLEDAVWSIPALKMKMRDPFKVPLSKQAVAIIEEVRKVSGDTKYLFPSTTRKSTIATCQLGRALRRMGYAEDEMTAHGFRSTASTLLNEHSDFSPDVIEMSLAHVPPGVRGLYNRAKYWIERVELSQWYADYLDELRDRGVPAIHKTPQRQSANLRG